MIKRILILVLCLAAYTLSAQTGLFDLTYGESISSSKDKMEANSFTMIDQRDSVVEYVPDSESPSYKYVDGIILIVVPQTQKLAGWFIKYNGENSTDVDKVVLDALVEMHGDDSEYDEDTDQLMWMLGGTRSLHVMYTMETSLSVLYFDSKHEQLFMFND